MPKNVILNLNIIIYKYFLMNIITFLNKLNINIFLKIMCIKLEGLI